MAVSVGSTVMLERWFLSHPRSVNESYLEHQAHALRFSGSLLLAAGACFIHALVPGLFQRTGSRTIERLHDEMVVHRKRTETAAPRTVSPTATLSRSDA
jgi:coenzyme F420-reducing hydrogenase gamma subunit